MDGSLAGKVETENPLARTYVDYLLGRVKCCASVDELRQYRTAITAEGMLYQGYVARALSRERMDDAFIGRYAVTLRIRRLEEETAQLEDRACTPGAGLFRAVPAEAAAPAAVFRAEGRA